MLLVIWFFVDRLFKLYKFLLGVCVLRVFDGVGYKRDNIFIYLWLVVYGWGLNYYRECMVYYFILFVLLFWLMVWFLFFNLVF